MPTVSRLLIAMMGFFLSLGAGASSPDRDEHQRRCAEFVGAAFGSRELPLAMRNALVEWSTQVSKLPAPGTNLENWPAKRLPHATKALHTLIQAGKAANLAPTQTHLICEQVGPEIAQQFITFVDSAAVTQFYDTFCEKDSATLKILVTSSLRVARYVGLGPYTRVLDNKVSQKSSEQQQVKRFLQTVVQKEVLQAEDWINLLQPIDDYPHVVIADAIERDWAVIGLDESQVLNFTRLLLARPFAFDEVINVMNLDRAHWPQIEADLNPAQWVRYKHLTGTLNNEALILLEDRLKAFRPTNSPILFENENVFYELLGDIHLPYEIFQKAHDLFVQYWPILFPDRTFNLTASLSGQLYRKRFSPQAMPRVELFAGEAFVYPERVWARARDFAAKWQKTLGTKTKFGSTREFIDHFTLKRHFDMPAKTGYDFATEDYARIATVAESYFKELLRQLPAFFALNPTVAELRWLLETPLQLPIGLHNDRAKPLSQNWIVRTVQKRLTKRRYYDLSTYRFIMQMMEQAIEFGKKRIETIEDAIDLATFKVPAAAEYEQFQRFVLADTLDIAVKVGDGGLQWLDGPLFENQHTLSMYTLDNRFSWFWQLVELRNSVTQLRGDSALTKRAIEWILGSKIETKAHEVLFEYENSSLRRVLWAMVDAEYDGPIQPDPKMLEQAVRHLRTGLFRYLAARSEAGVSLFVNASQLEQLTALARESGYSLTPERSTPSDRVSFKLESARP